MTGPNLDECIKHDGKRPDHIAPDAMVECWDEWSKSWEIARKAIEWSWFEGQHFRFRPLTETSDNELEAECIKRGWKVEKPLVTQEELDRLADAFEAAGHWNFIFDWSNEEARKFIDTYEAGRKD